MTTKSNSKLIPTLIISGAILLFVIGIGTFFLLKNIGHAFLSTAREKDKLTPIYENNTKIGIQYREKMIDFYSMVDMARAVMPVDTSLTAKEKSLSNIRDIGIYYWKRNLEVLDELDQLNLDEQMKKRNAVCRKYCTLNQKCFELIYKAIDERSRVYDNEINQYIAQINQIYKEIR